MHRVKKYLPYLVAALAVFFLLSKPAQAARLVNNVFDGALAGAHQITVFLSHIAI